MNIFVTGATGFIGKALIARLIERGDRVTAISRSAARAKEALGDKVTIVEGELETPGAWSEALAGCDAVVHLAGEPVAAKRWDARQKQVIRDSRVEGTRMLVEAIGKLAAKPKVLVSASGTDYYPPAHGEYDDDDVTERDAPGEQFLARVCRDWEKEAIAAEAHGLRVVRLRIGAVLANDGGALERIVPTFKAFVGGSLGSGKQWFSWIHRDDVLGVILAALDDGRYTGAYNVVAPQATRYRELAKALGHELHRPSFWRVPGFALKIMVGEFAEALLSGRKVVPKALIDQGYKFAHPELATALAASM